MTNLWPCQFYRYSKLEQSKILQQLGKQLRIGMNIYDLACPVQMWALVFLQSSTHIDERFMAVLLDWLDHKVAILNLLQVTDHLTATPQFLHSRMIDLVHENSILLLKVLNLEKNSNIRHLSNHFDVVSSPRPVESADNCPQPVLNRSST